MNECFDALAAVVVTHGGTVEKFIGDAVCALFGAPVVHEDDPVRALQCSIEMQQTVANLERRRLEREKADADGLPALALRIGVSTGEVVGGTAERAGQEHYSVTGDAVNTASRLQGLGEAGQILVAASTERLSRHAFLFESAGEVKLKGKRAAVPVFLLRGIRPDEGNSGHALIDRRTELEHLDYCLNLAAEASPQLVEIVGDAGVGKSALVNAFADHAETAVVVRGICPPMAAGALDAFQRIASGLASAVENPEARSAALEALASGVSPTEGDVGLDTMAHGLHLAIRDISLRWPVVIIVEDVQRADPDTLELVRRLVELISPAERLMILWTRRTGEEMLLDGDYATSLTRLVLKPLSETDTRLLMTTVLDGSELPEELQDLIVERSGGNPLYVEALTTTVVEDGDLLRRMERPGQVEVPGTVQGLIQARLDSIPENERLVLQEAAVVGREFDAALLRRVDLFGVDVESCLAALARRGLIEPVGESTYRFGHVLTQEVAYDTMLQGLRQELHREVADALVEMSPDRMSELAPALADHYAKAGDTDRAVEVLVQAGQGEQ